MDWYSIGIAAACGALAAAISSLVATVVKDKKNRSRVTGLTSVVLFFVIFSIAQTTLIADHRAEVALEEFASITENNPAFDGLKEYAPEIYDEVINHLRAAVDRGDSPREVETGVRQIISQVVNQRLGRAADDVLLRSVQLSIDQMLWLRERDDDSCFHFLFPQVEGGISALAVLSPELMERDQALLGDILATYDASRPISTEEEAMDVLTPIYLELFQKYGQEPVMQLADPVSAGLDRGLVCDMSIDVYEGVLANPEPDAVRALRWMMQ